MGLIISIGILAYNEAFHIRETLNSLFQQSIFQSPVDGWNVEIIIVPNGCTDDTVTISELALSELAFTVPASTLEWKICDIQQPGKSNAWNQYVHEFSNVNADYLILMDADIRFLETHTLRNMISSLHEAPEKWVAIDVPVKDIVFKQKRNLMEKLSMRASEASKSDGFAICGQLYCARSSALRKIWMPVGLPVEDGFLCAMVTTECFTTVDDTDNILLAPESSHMFEAYVKVPDLLRHEKRLLVGSTINAYLFGYLWKSCLTRQDAGSLIKENNQNDPYWLSHLIQNAIKNENWWIIPNAFLFRRFQRLKSYNFFEKVLKFPFTVLAFLVDVIICYQANQEIHRSGGLGYWGKTNNKGKN